MNNYHKDFDANSMDILLAVRTEQYKIDPEKS
jgi:hypothetical protein